MMMYCYQCENPQKEVLWMKQAGSKMSGLIDKTL